MDSTTVLVLNGPNLNLLGEREPEIYGRETLADVEALCRAACEDAGLTLDFRQSNHEGVLIDWAQEGRRGIAGIVVNAAGYTHTSVALRDALSAVAVPRVEVHISDIHAREEFRHHSYLTDVTDHQVIGRGTRGYIEAISWIHQQQGLSRRGSAGVGTNGSTDTVEGTLGHAHREGPGGGSGLGGGV